MGCKDNLTEPSDFIQLNADIRMEVQILDTTYQFYSRPHTKIYFTTYKVGSDNVKTGLQKSDTTSCPNGWGVKLLNYTFNNAEEKIILGAACEDYNGKNYKEIIIGYNEAEARIDTLNHSSIIKTFSIFYK
ncbi:MAG: hypothetical protein JEY94_05555 [Melioribacteraceae bacterium]|nr:hypothetical protein [Melioribacteraceae bacterium]